MPGEARKNGLAGGQRRLEVFGYGHVIFLFELIRLERSWLTMLGLLQRLAHVIEELQIASAVLVAR